MNNKITPKVLLVEDETTLSMIIKDTLSDEGYEVICASNGIEGVEHFIIHHPQIVIADVMMPEMDGFDMVKKIRQLDLSTPILFLTARSSIEDLVFGFNLGANDYLKKPFKMIELVMRIRALTNRIMSNQSDGSLFSIGEYGLNITSQTLSFKNQNEELSYLETEILKRMCVNRNNIVEIKDILNELWNDDSYYNRNSLHVFIHKLRKKLSKDTSIKIINIRGIGYKLTTTDLSLK